MDHALLLSGSRRPSVAASSGRRCSRGDVQTLRAATLDRSVAATEMSVKVNEWASNGTTFEYGSAANPNQHPIPIDVFPGAVHSAGPSMVIPLDLSHDYELPYPATSPNLLGNYVRIVNGERIETVANATSHMFYCIRGSGTTRTEWGDVKWKKGDVFALPASEQPSSHHADDDCEEGAATLYWVNDSPMCSYLGVKPSRPQFEPTFWKEEVLTPQVYEISKSDDPSVLNRCGVLLCTNATKETTKTMSHILWCLYNLLPPKMVQAPHKHSSIAIDLVISCPKGCYSLMGPVLKADGTIEDPVKVDWQPQTVFTTPPGWWHSHHNDSNEEAWVLPIQDAGLYTYQRTLNIRFGEQEQNIISDNKEIGATFKGAKINFH